MSRRSEIVTPVGPAWVDLDLPAERVGLLVLGHGAGGGVDAPDLLAARDAALACDWAVARVTQPYRVAGRRSPPPPAQLDPAWTTVVRALRRRASLRGLPVITGGRSSGARVACRTAAACGVQALLLLAFPLHPPGRPEKSRLPELDAVEVPVLIVQGDRDPFGMPPATATRIVHVVAGADHSLKRRSEITAPVTTLMHTISGSPGTRAASSRGTAYPTST